MAARGRAMHRGNSAPSRASTVPARERGEWSLGDLLAAPREGTPCMDQGAPSAAVKGNATEGTPPVQAQDPCMDQGAPGAAVKGKATPECTPPVQEQDPGVDKGAPRAATVEGGAEAVEGDAATVEGELVESLGVDKGAPAAVTVKGDAGAIEALGGGEGPHAGEGEVDANRQLGDDESGKGDGAEGAPHQPGPHQPGPEPVEPVEPQAAGGGGTHGAAQSPVTEVPVTEVPVTEVPVTVESVPVEPILAESVPVELPAGCAPVEPEQETEEREGIPRQQGAEERAEAEQLKPVEPVPEETAEEAAVEPPAECAPMEPKQETEEREDAPRQQGAEERAKGGPEQLEPEQHVPEQPAVETAEKPAPAEPKQEAEREDAPGVSRSAVGRKRAYKECSSGRNLVQPLATRQPGSETRPARRVLKARRALRALPAAPPVFLDLFPRVGGAAAAFASTALAAAVSAALSARRWVHNYPKVGEKRASSNAADAWVVRFVTVTACCPVGRPVRQWRKAPPAGAGGLGAFGILLSADRGRGQLGAPSGVGPAAAAALCVAVCASQRWDCHPEVGEEHPASVASRQHDAALPPYASAAAAHATALAAAVGATLSVRRWQHTYPKVGEKRSSDNAADAWGVHTFTVATCCAAGRPVRRWRKAPPAPAAAEGSLGIFNAIMSADRPRGAAESPVPLQPVPLQPVPLQPVPVEPVPVEPVPLQPTPAELAPAECAPVEPEQETEEREDAPRQQGAEEWAEGGPEQPEPEPVEGIHGEAGSAAPVEPEQETEEREDAPRQQGEEERADGDGAGGAPAPWRAAWSTPRRGGAPECGTPSTAAAVWLSPTRPPVDDLGDISPITPQEPRGPRGGPELRTPELPQPGAGTRSPDATPGALSLPSPQPRVPRGRPAQGESEYWHCAGAQEAWSEDAYPEELSMASPRTQPGRPEPSPEQPATLSPAAAGRRVVSHGTPSTRSGTNRVVFPAAPEPPSPEGFDAEQLAVLATLRGDMLLGPDRRLDQIRSGVQGATDRDGWGSGPRGAVSQGRGGVAVGARGAGEPGKENVSPAKQKGEERPPKRQSSAGDGARGPAAVLRTLSRRFSRGSE